MAVMPTGIAPARGREVGRRVVEVRWGVVLEVGLENQVVQGMVGRIEQMVTLEVKVP
jgi:hypothetical protein